MHLAVLTRLYDQISVYVPPVVGGISQASVTAPQSGSTALPLSALSAVPAGNTVTVTNLSTNLVPIEFYA